jgi:hypothetical protein
MREILMRMLQLWNKHDEEVYRALLARGFEKLSVGMNPPSKSIALGCQRTKDLSSGLKEVSSVFLGVSFVSCQRWRRSYRLRCMTRRIDDWHGAPDGEADADPPRGQLPPFRMAHTGMVLFRESHAIRSSFLSFFPLAYWT